MKVKVQLVVCDDEGHEETVTDVVVLEKACQRIEEVGLTLAEAKAPDFSALCSRPGFMRPPGEIPMKVLMAKGFLAARSHASKPCLSIRELAGTRFTSMPVMPGGTGRRNRCQNLFRFTYFHGLSATRPLRWPLRMTNGKVSYVHGRGPGHFHGGGYSARP